MEFAQSQKGKPQALSIAAAASMRLYKRVTAAAQPIIAVRVPAEEHLTGLPPIDLDRFRRQPLTDGGGA